MKIASVSIGSSTAFSSQSDSNMIKLLERQKEQLQDQIKRISEGKLDDKTKQDQIKQLQDQIQQIEAEIQQKRADMLKQNRNTDQQETGSRSNNTGGEDSGSATDMFQLVQASGTYSRAKLMNSTRNSLNGKAKVLKTEIKLDGGRGGATEAKQAEVREIESKEQELGKKVGESFDTARKQLKKAKEAADDKGKEPAAADGAEKEALREEKLNSGEQKRTNLDIRI